MGTVPFLPHIDYVQHDTICDAVHPASLPKESELRLGGLIHPSG